MSPTSNLEEEEEEEGLYRRKSWLTDWGIEYRNQGRTLNLRTKLYIFLNGLIRNQGRTSEEVTTPGKFSYTEDDMSEILGRDLLDCSCFFSGFVCCLFTRRRRVTMVVLAGYYLGLYEFLLLGWEWA